MPEARPIFRLLVVESILAVADTKVSASSAVAGFDRSLFTDLILPVLRNDRAMRLKALPS